MSFEVTGKLHTKYEIQQVNERFRKREFVLELSEEINGNVYTNYAKMQLVQNKCEILDRFNEGDQLKVNFNIKGNRWEKDGKVNFITNLDAWRIEPVGGASSDDTSYAASPDAQTAPAPQQPVNNFNNPSPDSTDDLPF